MGERRRRMSQSQYRKQAKPAVAKRKRTEKSFRELSIHAINRARQRYGVFLTLADIAKINQRIQRGQWVNKERESHTRTHGTIYWHGRPMRCVYNSKVSSVCTFLPMPGSGKKS